MQRFLKVLNTSILFTLSFIVQLFWLNNTNLFGVKPNMLLISVIVVSLYTNIYSSAIYSFIIGFITDMLFGGSGVFTISYTVIGIVLGFLSENYMKDNIFSSVILTIVSVIIFEIIEYFGSMIAISSYISLFILFKDLILSILLNVVLVFIVNFLYGRINDLIDKKEETIYW